LLAHGRWFSTGTPASSTTQTGRHDIAEILLKLALKHQNLNSIQIKTEQISWVINGQCNILVAGNEIIVSMVLQ